MGATVRAPPRSASVYVSPPFVGRTREKMNQLRWLVADLLMSSPSKSTAQRRARLPPPLALFLLAPTIAELLSGSSPPSEFFNPVAFVLMAGLYGSGAVLMRELAIRWGRGYASLLVLGAAYGIVEEGLMVKSFFDPNWPDLGLLGVYGRWADVNWVWAEMLTVYHAVFTITIPVLLTELAYPLRRSQPWASRRLFTILTAVLVATVVVGFIFLTPYRPPRFPYLMAAVLTALLVALARRLPERLTRGKPTPLPKPRSLMILGFAWSVGFFLNFWALPHIVPVPIFVMLSGGLLTAGFAFYLARLDWGHDDKLHQWAVAAGIMSFLILLAPLQELDQSRTDNPRGMALVGLAFLLGLLWLGRRIMPELGLKGTTEVIYFPNSVATTRDSVWIGMPNRERSKPYAASSPTGVEWARTRWSALLQDSGDPTALHRRNRSFSGLGSWHPVPENDPEDRQPESSDERALGEQ